MPLRRVWLARNLLDGGGGFPMSASSDVSNAVFDEIIAARRSIRGFTDEVPARAAIDSILAATAIDPWNGTQTSATP